MELWGSYAGPGLHVPGMALACAEDRYSFCGTKRRGGAARGGGARQDRQDQCGDDERFVRSGRASSRVAAKRDGRTVRPFDVDHVLGATRAGHSADGCSGGRTSVSSRVPVPNPNDGSETFLEFTCLPKKDTSRFSRTE